MNISKKIKIDTMIFLFLIIISIIIGFFAIQFLSNPISGDSMSYHKLANSLSTNYSFIVIDDYWVSPGYPVFLAIIYKFIGSNPSIIYYAQFILLGITGFLVYLIAKNFFYFSPIAAVIPAVLLIFWPYAIYYSAQILTEVFYMLLLTIFAYLFLLNQKNENIKYAIAAGIILGLTALSRPLPLLLPFWFFIIIIIIKIINKKINSFPVLSVSLKKIIIAFTVFYLTIMPWIIYSSFKFKKIIPVTAPTVDTQKENDKYFFEWSFYQTPGYEPGAEVTLQKTAIIKIKNFFRFWRSGLNGNWFDNVANEYPIIDNFTTAYRLFHYTIIFFFFYSIKYYYKDKYYFLLLQIILYTWLLHSILHTQPRYTLPIMPIVILFSCLGFYSFITYIKNAYKVKTKNN